jgi:hypothetical protein
LTGPAWQAARPEICAGLSLDPEPRRALEQLGAQLDSAYRQTAERLPEFVRLSGAGANAEYWDNMRLSPAAVSKRPQL